MFVREKSLLRIDITGDIVDLYRSINRARVAPEGAELQPCDACVISMKTGNAAPSVFVVLFLTVNRLRQIFVPEQQPTTMFEYERFLQEALDFAESIGFMLDSVEVDNDPQRSSEIVKSIPALYIPGIDPAPGLSHNLSSFYATEGGTLSNEPEQSIMHSGIISATPPTSAPSRPSDLLARLRSLVKPGAEAEDIFPDSNSDDEASGELILDDLALFEPVEEGSLTKDGHNEVPSIPEPPAPVFKDSLESTELFDDYAPLELGSDLEATESVSYDDLTDRDSAVDAGVFDDTPGETLLESGVQSCESEIETEIPAEALDSEFEDDVDLLFADFSAVMNSGEESLSGEVSAGTGKEAEPVVAEIVEEDRSSVPHTTDLSRLAAGSILEQIGKLLGSL